MKRFETLSFLPKKKMEITLGSLLIVLKKMNWVKFCFLCAESVSVDKSYDSNDSHGDRKWTA